MITDNKEVHKKLNKQGYRITKAREIILTILNKSPKHLSVDDIYLAIKASGKNVGTTTIYRAVDSLTKAGVIRKLSLLNGRASFKIINGGMSEHHHHLICRHCQKVIEYSDFIEDEIKLIKKLETIVSKAHQFKIEDHQLSFTGLCKSCKAAPSLRGLIRPLAASRAFKKESFLERG
ncbi:MAG: transcriptional repressor [Candidatus Omnitrophica bacterium]|nr:transcriptional repressor [Candidatus Omnitrophota bacterium]